MPLIVTIIQKITRTLELISPKLALNWTSKLFFSPRKIEHKPLALPDLQETWLDYTSLGGQQNKCRVYSAGTGPVALLVHGWEGSAYSLSAIANALLENGMRIVMFDLPAHGVSPGKKTNLVEISRIIEQLATDITTSGDQLHAIIGHSFGAATSGHAIKYGESITTQYFISISAPSTMDYIINHFCKMIGASEKTKNGLIGLIEDIVKEPYHQLSLTELATDFREKQLKGMIIHDRKDRLIPYTMAEQLADSWPEAKLMLTEGFGHNRILINPEVIQAIVKQLTNNLPKATISP